MNGAREEYKKAKKDIEKLWNHRTETFKSNAKIVFEFLPTFDQIEKVANKEAFASGLSLFFLALADDYFEKLKDFTLKVIQHPDGHVREAVRKTADWLFCSLTSRADPFVHSKSKNLSEAQKFEQIKARKQYLGYVKEIETLIEKYDTKEDEAEYVNEMKPSINKSLQQLWGRLTESRAYRKTLEATNPIPYEIFLKRKEIEQEITDMLRKTKSHFDLEDVKSEIFNESESDDMQRVIAMFDNGNPNNLSNILELVTEAWNYFPHKVLRGLSPAERLSEYPEQ